MPTKGYGLFVQGLGLICPHAGFVAKSGRSGGVPEGGSGNVPTSARMGMADPIPSVAAFGC